MSPIGLLRRAYRTLDRLVLSRLPHATQRALKAPLLRVGQTLYPRLYAGAKVELLIREREREPSGALAPLPQWALDEIAAIGRDIEPSLDVSGYAGSHDIHVVQTLRGRPGAVYRQLRDLLPGHVDTLLVVPWLKPGGADLGVLHYARGLAGHHGRSVAILATEPETSPWGDRVPEGVAFVEAGAALATLDEARGEPHAVLARLCLQEPPGALHVVGSRLGWEVYTRFGRALAQRSRLYASLFCDDYEPSGRRVGWAVRYLRDAYQHLDAVITDNTRTPREWVDILGMPAELFRVVPFPAPASAGRRSASGRRVLWAGRLDRQKRPELLAAIAARMPDCAFDVFGSQVVPGHGGDLAGLRRLPNVHLRGPFSGLDSVVDDSHVALVYTTGWDGMPNVLLEAAALGLPIVAPDVGGIGDFIAAEDIVADGGDIDAYVARLRRLLDSAAARQAVVARQDAALAMRTQQQFAQALLEVPGYVTSTSDSAKQGK